jgi:hypothetical protein
MSAADVWPSPGSDDDRAWFERHPRRSYRLRRSYPDEAPDDLILGWVIVRQIAPGLRLRAVVGLNTDTPRDDEENARRLFEQATGGGEARLILRAVEETAR